MIARASHARTFFCGILCGAVFPRILGALGVVSSSASAVSPSASASTSSSSSTCVVRDGGWDGVRVRVAMVHTKGERGGGERERERQLTKGDHETQRSTAVMYDDRASSKHEACVAAVRVVHATVTLF